MEDFLNKLYNYEYFGTYLMITIAVLVLLFIIVLFFGKKDKRKREIEETKKLQQINSQDAFKEENNVASVEVPTEAVPEPTMTQEKLENDTIIVPNINNINPEMPTVKTEEPQEPLAVENNNAVVDEIPEPIIPTDNGISELAVNEQPVLNNDVANPVEAPILDKVEEKPLVFNEPVVDVNKEETTQPQVQLSDVPDFNFDEIINGVEEVKEETTSKPTEIFSSVYAPEKEEIELPKIDEKKAETDDIELPTLKKETEGVEMPVLNDYNLDNIVGEDYNINK